MGQRFMGVGMVATIVGVYILVFFIANNFLPQDDRYKTVAEFIQLATAVLAIVFAGILAAVKLELFRDFEPHLNVSHTVRHRRLGDLYIHVDVTAVMSNNSKVKVELREGYFLLQQIAPVSSDTDFRDGIILYPDWPVLAEASFDLGNSNIILEPGQSLQEVFQFMVPNHIQTFLIHYLLYNSALPGGTPRGWGITEVYDIIDNET